MNCADFAIDLETLTTEITIAPDGCVFVFGTSRPVLEVLEKLQPGDARVRLLLEQVRRSEPQTAVVERR
jgi:hypothetical protein